MTNTVLKYSIRFFLLVLLQVLLFNHINFLGYVNPYLYILFIMLFPILNNRFFILLFSFLIGLVIDIFLDSGGVHAAACVTTAYLRPVFLRLSFGVAYEHQTIKSSTTSLDQRFNYFFMFILIHHLILFSMEIFNISKIVLILKNTILSGVFTLVLSLIVVALFNEKNR